MKISNEAMEAAFDAALHLPITNAEVEQIVFAAAAHVMAAAWDEGYDEADQESIYNHSPTNPYRRLSS